MADIDAWLEMINDYLNPWKVEITEANLNMLGADENGALYSTTGVIAGGMDSFTDYSQYLNG